MNWLGQMAQGGIGPEDTVLDVGCGIMQHTTGFAGEEGDLVCKTLLGVDLYDMYLNVVKPHYPTVKWDVKDLAIFPDKSYDAIILMDIVEHLKLEDALHLIDECKRVARKFIFLFTPSVFITNEENTHNVWGLGDNHLQEHHCLLTVEQLREKGFQANVEGSSIFATWKNTPSQ